MPQPSIVLHIGLHKTATRFLQRAVFRSLDPALYWVNPEPLGHALRQAARHPGDEKRRARARAAAAEARAAAGTRTLVLSDPAISGDMYNSHADYLDNLELVHELFPDASVIYFVRRQSDWLQSAYRQALVKGHGQPIERFLNFYDGAFRERIAPRLYGVRNVAALTLRFLDIYRAYADRYGAQRVFLLRQEDLRQRPQQVYARLAEALGLESLPQLPRRVSGNRAFSAQAIRLFFNDTARAPEWPPASAAEPPPPARWPRLDRLRRRARTVLIRHVFDRIVYRDWDLLARHAMRARLDAHYDPEFRAITAVTDRVLERGPGPEARAMADQVPPP
jgi:hypothetical protein